MDFDQEFLERPFLTYGDAFTLMVIHLGNCIEDGIEAYCDDLIDAARTGIISVELLNDYTDDIILLGSRYEVLPEA